MAYGADVRSFVAQVAKGLLLLLTALPCCGAAPEQPPGSERQAPARPSVLLVTLDTLRADRLADEGPMPRLRALAGRAVRFESNHSFLVSHFVSSSVCVAAIRTLPPIGRPGTRSSRQRVK